MVRQPVAFLMDEPLSNLDAALRVHMWAELTELHRRLGATFVYVTHDQAEALTMSDKMAVMKGGRILQFGTPDEIFSNPRNLAVAEFIGSPKINILRGEVDGAGRVSLLGAATGLETPAPAGPVQVGFRPEHLRLTVAAEGWAGRILHRENLGYDLYFHILLKRSGARVVVRGAMDQHGRLGTDQVVRVGFDPINALLFGADGARLDVAQRAPLEVSA